MRRAKRKIVDKFTSWRRRRRGVIDGDQINQAEDQEGSSIENDDFRTAQLYGTVPLQKNNNASKPKRPLLSNLFRKGQYDQHDLTALQKSAENGNVRCQVKLGRLHLSDGCENASAKEGIEWLIKASKVQNVEATEVLKDCLTSGLGIDQENRNQVIWCIKTSNKIKRQVLEENLLLLRIRRMRFRRTSSMDDIDILREAEFREDSMTGIPLKELVFSKKHQNVDDDSQSLQNADNNSQSQQIADDDHNNKSAVDDNGNNKSENMIQTEIQDIAAVSNGEDCVDTYGQHSQDNVDCVDDTANDSQESIHENDAHQVKDSASQCNHANDSNQDMDKDIIHGSNNNEDDHIVPAAPPNSILDQTTPHDQSQLEIQDISGKVGSNEELSHDENISHANQNGNIPAVHHSSPKNDDEHNVNKKISKATNRLKSSGASNSPLTRKNCKKETHFGASSTVTVLKDEAAATAL